MNSQANFRDSSTVFYRASRREFKIRENKSISLRKKSVISQNVKSKFKDSRHSKYKEKRNNKSENRRNSGVSNVTTSSFNKNLSNSSISNLDKNKKSQRKKSLFMIRNKKNAANKYISDKNPNTSSKPIKYSNNNTSNHVVDDQFHNQYKPQIDVPNKFQRKDFDIYLSPKLKLKISIMYFVNPSIYAYDSFLNSLIYISKFNKYHRIPHSTNHINKDQFPKLDIKKSSICSFQQSRKQTSNEQINPKSMSILLEKENNNFTESQISNHPTDSINSSPYDINSDQGVLSNSEETVSSDNSDKFTEVIDYLENKLHKTSKRKELTMNKYKALNKSNQSFESNS
jgi:hypothetical protein